jgi:hypothetical protein
VTVWFLGASFLGWSPIPASMTRFAVFVIVGYYLFTGLRALIAYTLTTAIRLFFEGVAMTCTTMAQSLGERPAPIGQDGNVTFLKDVLAATGRSPFGKDVDA